MCASAPCVFVAPTDGAACALPANCPGAQGAAGGAGAASALARFQAENGIQDVDADAIYAYDRVTQVCEMPNQYRASRLHGLSRVHGLSVMRSSYMAFVAFLSTPLIACVL